jgi:hypothetical protein
MKTKLFIFHVLIPLTLGGILYITFRSSTLRMFDWFEAIGIDPALLFIRDYSTPLKSFLPLWTYFSFPDGLWVYSFTSAYIIIWNGKLTGWLFLPIVTGPVVEIAQALNIFPGTFDILDLVITIIGFGLGTIIINFKIKQNEKTVS